MRLLLEQGADVNSTGGWAIQSAATEGHIEVVQELLRRGADVNAVTTNDNFEPGTALQGACESGRTDIVELLLQHGANPNLGAGDMTCPLIAATSGSEQKITELLVGAGAEVNIVGGPDCDTPFINAVAYLPVESLKILLQAGAAINLPANDGNTPLLAAAYRGDAECVQFLLDNGADIMHVNHTNGMNALQMALQEENNECLVILVDAVSRVLASVKTAVDAGNEAVARVVRSAGIRKVGAKPPPEIDMHGTVHDPTTRPETPPVGENVQEDSAAQQESHRINSATLSTDHLQQSNNVSQSMEGTYSHDQYVYPNTPPNQPSGYHDATLQPPTTSGQYQYLPYQQNNTYQPSYPINTESYQQHNTHKFSYPINTESHQQNNTNSSSYPINTSSYQPFSFSDFCRAWILLHCGTPICIHAILSRPVETILRPE